ncbi:MAG: ATP-dependent Clp protease adaptor ClpS [Pseudomonadota bacterium]
MSGRPVRTAGDSSADRPDPYGIVAFNDPVTPMEDVVEVFTDALGLPHDEAIKRMIRVHEDGFAVIVTGEETAIDALLAKASRKAAAMAGTRDHPTGLRLRKLADPDGLAPIPPPPRAPRTLAHRLLATAWGAARTIALVALTVLGCLAAAVVLRTLFE